MTIPHTHTPLQLLHELRIRRSGFGRRGGLQVRRPKRTWVGSLILGVSGGLFALVVGLGALLVVIPKATGSVPLTVLTSSMEPALPAGTLVVVRPTRADDIRIGDVVTYQITPGDPAVVSHRVRAVRTSTTGERSFITQGDNNADPDAKPVRPVQIKGTVWYSVPWLGYLSTGMNPQRSWLVPFVAFALLGYAAVIAGIGGLELMRRRSHSLLVAQAAHRSPEVRRLLRDAQRS